MSGWSRISCARASRRDEPAHAIDDAEERAGIGVTGGAHLGQAAQLGQQRVDHFGLARRGVVLRHHEVEHQQPGGIPAWIDPREPREGIDQQARPDQQHRGDDHLRDDEHVADAGVGTAGAALPAGAAVVHDLHLVGPRHPERRHRAADERGDDREPHRQAEQAAIDADLVQARDHRSAPGQVEDALCVRRGEFAQHLDEADREQGTERSANGGKDQALRQQLPQHASAARTHRQPHRDLALPRRAAREQEARDVGAHDQQHRSDGNGDHAQARAGSRRRSVPSRLQPRSAAPLLASASRAVRWSASAGGSRRSRWPRRSPRRS